MSFVKFLAVIAAKYWVLVAGILGMLVICGLTENNPKFEPYYDKAISMMKGEDYEN